MQQTENKAYHFASRVFPALFCIKMNLIILICNKTLTMQCKTTSNLQIKQNQPKIKLSKSYNICQTI